MRNAHPLHDALIRPADQLYQVDPRFRRESVRALPTAATTRQRPEWRWRPTAPPSSTSGSPRIFSPSDLEPGRTREVSRLGSIADVARRLKR
jgi:hypothetical protein